MSSVESKLLPEPTDGTKSRLLLKRAGEYLVRLVVIAIIGLLFEPLIGMFSPEGTSKKPQNKLEQWSESQREHVAAMSLWAVGFKFYDEIETGGLMPLSVVAHTGEESAGPF